MHPREHAAVSPGKAAIVMAASGNVVTYGELVERADRCAQLFRSLGLHEGEGIGLCLENHPRYFEVCWAAHNAGLYYTPISSRLKTEEIAFIVRDCGARVFVTSAAMAPVAADLPERLGTRCPMFMIGEQAPTGICSSYEAALEAMPPQRVDEGGQGAAMMYSSGTTGVPKGIRHPLPGLSVQELAPLPKRLCELYGFDATTVYLSPAPLYHAAPLKFSLAVLAAGGTVIVMEKFDAAAALECIDRWQVTHSQWVPTMFVRMLRLPRATRQLYSLASHRVAIHSAAPCPVEVKERMIEWWGPIIHEYYSGSESIGLCAIDSHEWLRHKGSVGRAQRGVVHIVSESGEELPAGATGLVYFETATVLRYHNDPDKTMRAHNARGWATMGDIGYLDADGYLYLTDRRDFVIISGGVNIYPQEVENLLNSHPKVDDVAVFGVPNEEFGEEVKAVVVPRRGADAGPDLARELIDFCRGHIANLKCPKSIDFAEQLPREPTGKLLKKSLRERYWQGRAHANNA
jgi:acyl-CoA synthetase (AMP-forming)/AMP-acid ligase II